jgi:hypothetical protein
MRSHLKINTPLTTRLLKKSNQHTISPESFFMPSCRFQTVAEFSDFSAIASSFGQHFKSRFLKTEELANCDNRNASKWMQNQQILISTNDRSCFTINSQFQKLIIFGIAAFFYLFLSFY